MFFICNKNMLYPVNCVKDVFRCSTTSSEGLQAGGGLAQVHGCHEYPKEHL